MEPFRIKAVEPLAFPTVEERQLALTNAGYNLFRIPARQITIDLLTDSGTGAMSASQWAAMMSGDESYAGARSFERFESVVGDLTGYREVIPVHQGRAAERLVFSSLLEPGDISVSNTHFDTTRANVEHVGAQAIDMVVSSETNEPLEFGGDLDIDAVTKLLESEDGSRVRCVVLTITNNAGGGQPVSMANVRAARALCDRFNVPLWLDASRFAENAYLVTERDPDYAHLSPRAVAEETFRLADGCWASLKKDAIANMGGVIALQDSALAERLRQLLITTEGFSTYGGLAGRDLEAIAQGLLEVTDTEYLRYRAQAARWFGAELEQAGLPVQNPTGCHAVYVDAAALLPHIPVQHFPGQALACALYEQAAIRTCELGTLAFGAVDPAGGPDIAAPKELVRFALPRRVYTRNHLEYVIEAAATVAAKSEELPGYSIVSQPSALRHFSAHLAPISA
ncbi:MAG: tryptophanase [Corynebacteriales bacterium]|nr:tryptophanase [Mycobacteriales bacterium]